MKNELYKILMEEISSFQLTRGKIKVPCMATPFMYTVEHMLH